MLTVWAAGQQVSNRAHLFPLNPVSANFKDRYGIPDSELETKKQNSFCH